MLSDFSSLPSLAEPINIEALHQQALDHARSDRLEQAEAIYRDLIARGHGSARLFSNLGALCGFDGRLKERLHWLQQAVELDPTYLLAQINLGVAHHDQAQLDLAVTCFRTALALEADSAQAHQYLAIALAGQGNLEAAQTHFLRAMQLEPDRLEPQIQLARLSARRGERLLAETLFRACLAVDPNHLECLIQMGLTLMDFGKAEDALQYFLYALSIQPDSAPALAVNAFALQAMGDLQQAVELYKQALISDPTHREVPNRLALCYSDLGMIQEAIDTYRRALDSFPEDYALRLNLAVTLRSIGELETSIELIDEVLSASEIPDAFLCQMFSYGSDMESHAPRALELARAYWPRFRTASNDAAASLPAAAHTAAAHKSTSSRIRIGILSAEIGHHVVANFLSSFLHHYDRSCFEVELISVHRRYEQFSQDLASLCDHSFSVHGLAEPVARKLIRERNYDVILETSGFTRNTALPLLAERCALVQCHYIGYHATTGLDTIDYFIGDDHTTPHCFADQFSETLWRLPRPWLAYSGAHTFPHAQSLAQSERPVFGSFNQIAKVREATLRFWAAAVCAVPDALLLIKDRSACLPSVRNRITATLTDFGVQPDRLRFLPAFGAWEHHMQMYNTVDLALDATPWSSATTGFEALGMGVPLLAIQGRCTAARMSTSLVRAIGHPEWAVETPEAYGGIAESLCQDLESLRNGKDILQREVLDSKLFDEVDLSLHLQQAFRGMLADQNERNTNGLRNLKGISVDERGR